MTSGSKAFWATAIFTVVFIVAIFMDGLYTAQNVPVLIFYVLLLINTYVSIKLFSSVIPNTWQQVVLDTALFIFYLVMPFCLDAPSIFSWLLTIYFVIANIKYIISRRSIGQPILMKRKIFIDSLGVAMGLIYLILVLIGQPVFASWFLLTVFGLANIYIFFVRPLYRLDSWPG